MFRGEGLGLFWFYGSLAKSAAGSGSIPLLQEVVSGFRVVTLLLEGLGFRV